MTVTPSGPPHVTPHRHQHQRHLTRPILTKQHRSDARAAGMALVSAGVECRRRGRVQRERALYRVLRAHISGWPGEERGMARR
ncbi:unnamed protein product [Danaus chrysippus]|uniref:(African queen) hypothetical protein n=1 Tax=Danaus chrysippus TaxID=151541 RepID=A0A8J2QPR4_9NEOP|nr:unnamed protein product [Danaus chrysippus]